MTTQSARTMTLEYPGTDKPQQATVRSWAIRGLKLVAGLAGLVALVYLGYFVAVAVANDPLTAYRQETSGDSNIYTYQIFPQRAMATGGSASPLPQASLANFPSTVTYTFGGSQTTTSLNDLFAQTDTQAFIVVRDNAVVYEKYLNGTSRDTLHNSFSMAKSFTSALVGIAIDEGKIHSVDDPLIHYVPELQGRGFDSLTLRDMLRMSSGVAFHTDVSFGPLNNFVSDDSKQYYTDNLRGLLLSVQRSDEPVGAVFHYNDFYPLLEGLILQRVTGETVAQYTQDKLWQPMGAEYPASWSLDSTADGFEKMNSSFNARAIDYARIGLVFLNQGRWNGRQIVSPSWVSESTMPDPADRRPWQDHVLWQQAGGYYKYAWWGLNNSDGTYDYLANGKDGQFIYVSPATHTVAVRLGWGADPMRWPFVIQSLVHPLK